jgi:signal transduction histidine kinase
MGKVANQIAGGNLSDRVLQCGGLSDELGELVCNFNRMASRLEANRDEMNVLHSRLEDKVRERTSALEIANRKLRESDRQKSEFLATISHELRTPLTSITAYAEILVDSGSIEPEKRARFLSIINTEAARMSRLITDLLSLERIENGMARWQASAFDLREVVKAAAAVLGPALAEKRMHLSFTMLEAQPVLADADRIQEVLTNLLGNALKFCRPNGHIGIALQHVSASGPRNASGDYVRIEVIDDGPGIPPEDRDQIFEKFYQGANTRGRHSGVGLGLAISREIILHHKGEIWLELPQTGGTVFCFTLPRHSTAIEFQSKVLEESYTPA